MSEQIKATETEKKVEQSNNTTAEVNGEKLEQTVENGKVVYTKATPKKDGLFTKIKKGVIKIGYAIKEHPVATALIVGVGGAGIAGAKHAYDVGTKDGFADGYSAKTKEIEDEQQRKLELEELMKLEAQDVEDIPEMETVVNELGEEVG